jgi:hypothetical protein
MLDLDFLAWTTALLAVDLASKYLPSTGPSEDTSSTVLLTFLISATAACMPARAVSGSIIFGLHYFLGFGLALLPPLQAPDQQPVRRP